MDDRSYTEAIKRSREYIKKGVEQYPAGIAVIIAVIVFSVGLTALFWATGGEYSKQDTQPAASKVATENTNPFDAVELEARSAVVWSVTKHEALYTKNPRVQLPLASLSKIMTVLAADRHLEPNTTVTITKESIAADGDNGLLRGERWYYKDIRDFTLVESSNDGARAIAQTLAEKDHTEAQASAIMSKIAREIGLEQTYYLNPSGLDVSEEAVISGGYGSAHDISLLMAYIVRNHPDMMSATTKERITVSSLNGISHTAENTNKIVSDIPFLIASKTGFTDLAGGNLTVAFDLGLSNTYVITVLGSTREGRFEDVKKLYNATHEYVTGTTTSAANIEKK